MMTEVKVIGAGLAGGGLAAGTAGDPGTAL